MTATRFERVTLVLLLAIQAGLILFLVWQGTVTRLKRPVITVLTLPMEQVHARFSPYGPGFDQEAVTLFCSRYGFTPRWVSASTWQQARDIFFEGEADLLVAPGIMPRSFGDDPLVQAGPVYEEHFPQFIHNQYRFGFDSPYGMCDRPIVVTDNPRVMEALHREINGTACNPPVESWDDFPLASILETLSHNLLKVVLIDGGRFTYWEPFFPELRRTDHLNRLIQYSWYWRTERADLAVSLEAFWREFLNSQAHKRLRDRYLGFFPKRMDYYELEHFASVISRELPKYRKSILKACRKNRLDPLLVTALIYQESRFDPQACSDTGVRGLMQITQATCEQLGLVNRLDPESSIEAGCRYLRDLHDRLDGKGATSWDRWFLTLSSYNLGFNHVLDAMVLAQEQDKDHTVWADMKSVLPLLSYSKYYKRLKYGYARGYEAVDFVESIRFYYYLLQGFVVLGRPEAEHLAPLLEARPGSWP